MALNTALPRLFPRSVRTIFLAISLVLSFRCFQFFPNIAPLQEAWFILVVLALGLVYLPRRWRMGGPLNHLEKYALFVLFVIPVWSAFAARGEFGQPMIYGILAERGIILVGAIPLLFGFVLKNDLITMPEVESVFIFLGWSTLVLYLAMFTFLDPSSYFLAYGAGFVTSPFPDAAFVFDPIFIIFAFYYYAFKGIKSGTKADYLRSGIFFLFCFLIIRGRSFVLSLLAAFLWFGIIWSPNKRRLLSFLLKITLIGAIILLVLNYSNSELFNVMTGKFSDAFTVLFTGEQSNDPSANSRISQTIIALPYIDKHWLFGNGVVSAQWNGGLQSTISEYFHPSDIGILGAIYLLGVMGTGIYLYQFRLAISYARERSDRLNQFRDFCNASKGFLLCFAIRSLATAEFMFRPEAVFFFLTILMVCNNEPDSVVNNSRQSNGV